MVLHVLYDVFKGAHDALSREQSLSRWLGKITKMTRLSVQEMVALLPDLPRGLQALTLYQTLTDQPGNQYGVVVKRNIRYGHGERQVMDIFIPEDLHVRQQQANQRQDGTQPAPAKVVFFCHGGIWMFGEKWHHCGLALRMAQAGLVVVAVEYTLYPTATVPQMIDELLLSLTWTFANIRQWGGDPHDVSVVGHSAGAHLVMMAVLHHAANIHNDRELISSCKQAFQKPTTTSSNSIGSSDPSSRDPREPASSAPSAPSAAAGSSTSSAADEPLIPVCCIGVCGVYELSKAHDYERIKGVSEISLMRVAIGGKHRFSDLSPAVIMARAAQQLAAEREQHAAAAAGPQAAQWARQQQQAQKVQQQVQQQQQGGLTMSAAKGSSSRGRGGGSYAAPACSHAACASSLVDTGDVLFYRAFPLVGEAVPYRLGFERHYNYKSSAAARGGGSSSSGSRAHQQQEEGEEEHMCPECGMPMSSSAANGQLDLANGTEAGSRQEPAFELPAAALRWVPPVVLISSINDHLVPFHESSEMYWRLLEAGIPAKHLMYNRVGHNDFVMNWPALKRQRAPEHAPESQHLDGSTSAGGGGSSSAAGDSEQQGAGPAYLPLPAGAPYGNLPPYNRDLLNILTGRVQVRYVTAADGAAAGYMPVSKL